MLVSLQGLALASNLVLGAVLLWTGVAKLRGSQRSNPLLEALGIQHTANRALVVGVSCVELLIGAALVLGHSARILAAACLALLLLLTLAVGWALALGRSASCNCFGAADNRPIGLQSLVRNGILLTLAVFAFAFNAADPWTAVLTPMATLLVFLTAAVFVLLLYIVSTVDLALMATMLDVRGSDK